MSRAPSTLTQGARNGPTCGGDERGAYLAGAVHGSPDGVAQHPAAHCHDRAAVPLPEGGQLQADDAVERPGRLQAAGGSDDDHGGYAYDDDSGGAAVPDEEVPDTQDVFGGGYTLRRQNAQRFQILWRLELVPYDWLLDYLNHLKRQMARIQQTQMRRQDRQRQHLHRQDQQR